MIYTSYFAKLKDFPENFLPISISQYPPKWYGGVKIKIFAPSSELLNKYRFGMIDEKEYTKQYVKQIANIDNIDKYMEKILEYCGDKIPVFLCFEKNGEFCHRHILAKLLSIYGYPCEEWKDK